MDNTIQTLIDFLKNNPKSNKAAITIATGLAGLHLFNLLKKLQTDGLVIQYEEGEEKTYSLIDSSNDDNTVIESHDTEEQTKEVQQPYNEQGAEVENAIIDNKTTETEQKAPKSFGRDSSKLKFNGEEYGKGPWVRAVVAQYVTDNPDTDYKKLKEVFPDDLLKRFGIFQDEETAAVIAKKGNRYFTKTEQVIKLKDKSVVVCNQFT